MNTPAEDTAAWEDVARLLAAGKEDEAIAAARRLVLAKRSQGLKARDVLASLEPVLEKRGLLRKKSEGFFSPLPKTPQPPNEPEE